MTSRTLKSPGSSASADETNSSITVTSSTFPVRHTTDAGEGSVLQFRHWANEHEEKNVATSYWYAKNEEEERKRQQQGQEQHAQRGLGLGRDESISTTSSGCISSIQCPKLQAVCKVLGYQYAQRANSGSDMSARRRPNSSSALQNTAARSRLQRTPALLYSHRRPAGLERV